MCQAISCDCALRITAKVIEGLGGSRSEVTLAESWRTLVGCILSLGGTIDWPALQPGGLLIRQAFETRLQQVVKLGCQRGERTPWTKTVRSAQ